MRASLAAGLAALWLAALASSAPTGAPAAGAPATPPPAAPNATRPPERRQGPPPDEYLVGVGLADITGPAAEINLMGYAKPGQDSSGIHLRQFSRAIVIEDARGARAAYLSLDSGMVSQLLRSRVLAELAQQFGGHVYNHSNVMMSATHTHSGPGGFFQYMLYNIPSSGFIGQTLEALVAGVVRSLALAHASRAPSHLFYARGRLLGASVNRSPSSYLVNPALERARYQHDTDKTMHVLRVDHAHSGRPRAMFSWFAVHGTSMNNSNHLISSDNKGYAALLFEHHMEPGALPGRGDFVAAFAQANEGDVSPNTRGPRCLDTGLPCDTASSTCGDPPRNELCVAQGPGRDMFESTHIIAHKQFNMARRLFHDRARHEPVRGPVRFVHEYIDMTSQRVPRYAAQARLERLRGASNASAPGPAPFYSTCPAAFGYSFAAGTTDGPGAFDFAQGTTSSSLFWNVVRDLLRRPSRAQTLCHAPKPILLSTGEMDFPYTWHPRIIPTQMLQLGQVFIVGLPGEFTTMSGRRVRAAVAKALEQPEEDDDDADEQEALEDYDDDYDEDEEDADEDDDQRADRGDLHYQHNQDQLRAKLERANRRHTRPPKPQPDRAAPRVILSGLSNVYSSYVATLEEYHAQRYEAASTLYGPHTLQAYVNQFRRLARRLARNLTQAPERLSPPDLSSSLFSLKPGVLFDGAHSGAGPFGSTIQDVDSSHVFTCGETAQASFVAGNPRNNMRLEGSFLYVQRWLPANRTWTPVASDANWDTKFIWQRTNSLAGESQAHIVWNIPAHCEPGVYRLRHEGAYKSLNQKVHEYAGLSSPFVLAGRPQPEAAELQPLQAQFHEARRDTDQERAALLQPAAQPAPDDDQRVRARADGWSTRLRAWWKRLTG